MKHLNKLRITMRLATLFCCTVSLFGGVAYSATTAPVVSVLPVIRDRAVTPTRITQDSSGNIYVTDPHAEGINVYKPDGSWVKKIVTEKEPGGIAFAKNGDLLVTQITYVAALNPSTGAVKARFGSFLSAFSIAVDNRPAGTGNIFVSDIKDYCIQVFNDLYADVNVSAGSGHNPYNPAPEYKANFIGDSFLTPYTYDPNFILPDFTSLFNRPAGVAIEKVSGKLAVVDSLNGSIRFFQQNGNAAEVIGNPGAPDPAHQFLKLTYPQSIAFEYTAGGALDRAYILDTFQSYVIVLDATSPTGPVAWNWLADIGLYGHHNGDLIVPSDIQIDKTDPDNNRLLVSNGFGSVSVYGLGSLQPFNVAIDSITNSSMRISWSNPAPASIKHFNVYRSTDASIAAGIPPLLVSGNNTGTSYVDTSLAQYTTYYYNVRSVDQTDIESKNIDQVSAKTTGLFNLSINIFGNGQVNGTAACTTGTCSSSQLSDSLITLTATATGQSVFDGWTGACFTTSDTCLITMDGAKSVIANFSAVKAFRVDGAYFDNLQDAYSEAKDGSVIRVLAGTWPSTTHSTEFMTAWQGKSVVIEGGYEPTFTTNTGGSSTVVGRTNLTAGKVVMKQFRLK